MEYLEFDDMRVPRIGLGTWKMTGGNALTSIQAAIDLGYRHIDTAQMYQNEGLVGMALRDSGVPRDEFFVTTKVWRDNLHKDSLLESVRDSLKRLALERVDLLLVHWPNEEVPLEETMGALNTTLIEGITKFIGVSNFPPGLLARAREMAPIRCEQAEYHLYLDQDRVIEETRRRGMFFTAYCPLAQGEVLSDPVLMEIGERHGKMPNQVALRWLLQQPQVVAIPKASSREHQASNLDVFDFQLSDEEMEQIAGQRRGERIVDPSFAPSWQS